MKIKNKNKNKNCIFSIEHKTLTEIKFEKRSNQQYTVNASVQLWIVCDLCILTPNNFTCLSDQTQFRNIYFQNST